MLAVNLNDLSKLEDRFYFFCTVFFSDQAEVIVKSESREALNGFQYTATVASFLILLYCNLVLKEFQKHSVFKYVKGRDSNFTRHNITHSDIDVTKSPQFNDNNTTFKRYICTYFYQEKMQKKPAKFLKLPEYPGGKEQFKKFVKEHLVYPKEALEKKIEGIVFLSASVSSKGEVSEIKVEKGIGYGCDEEAVRVLGLTHFGGVTNRGVRVKTRKKFRINFKLPPQKPAGRNLSYTLKKEQKTVSENKPKSYSYSIKINRD